MRIETLVFAALLALFAGPLLYAFGPAELAALRRLVRRWRVRRYAAAYYRAGVDLEFAYWRLALTPPRRRLAGGGR